MGHSGYNNWTNEQILTIADIEAMYNQRLPLVITASCSFSRFDDFKISGGEAMINHHLCHLILTHSSDLLYWPLYNLYNILII